MTDPIKAWRQAFDKVERAIGQPLESMTNTSRFASVMAVGARVRRTVERNADALLVRALHQVGLPARRDLSELASGVARVERSVRQLSHSLERMRDEAQQQAEADEPIEYERPPDASG